MSEAVSARLHRFLRSSAPAVLVVVVSFGVAACGEDEVAAGQDAADRAVTTSSPAPLATGPASPASPQTPSPTQVVTVGTVTETEAIPFARVSRDDPTMDAGVTAVTTTGVPGVKTVTFEVTVTDGVETSRLLIGEEVTTAPVDEVTSVGTYEPPPPPPTPEPQSGCDPNYSGGCVPIDDDVDCAGGSGNGPSYASGPVSVTGSDIYGLDSDNDGVGCEG